MKEPRPAEAGFGWNIGRTRIMRRMDEKDMEIDDRVSAILKCKNK